MAENTNAKLTNITPIWMINSGSHPGWFPPCLFTVVIKALSIYKSNASAKL